VRHPAVVDATIDTAWLDRNPDALLPAPEPPSPAVLAAAATAALLHQEQASRAAAAGSAEPGSPWAIADGWRLGHAGERLLVLEAAGERIELHAAGSAGGYRLRQAGGATLQVDGASLEAGILSLRVDGRGHRLRVDVDTGRVLVHDGESRLRFDRLSPYRPAAAVGDAGDDRIRAPMPGRVVLVSAAPGDRVEQGQEMLVMEAMKMELALRAPRAGVVAEVRAVAGDFVEGDTVLATLEPDADPQP